MKIAVLADIHANIAALEAVTAHLEAWQPDVVIVAGDIINRGPRPVACWHFVQHKVETAGWRVVIGNHEQYVIGQARPDVPRTGPAFEVHRLTYWTYLKLRGLIPTLAALPFQVSLTGPGGGEVRTTHASMQGTRAGIYPKMTPAEVRERIWPYPRVLCVGHTHLPLLRRVDGVLVLNVGSCGLPFDGDVRASYGQLTWHRGEWQAEIVRLPYDRAAAERDFYESDFLEGTGPLGRVVLDEWRRACSHLFAWTRDYRQQVMDGTLSMAEAVEAYLGR